MKYLIILLLLPCFTKAQTKHPFPYGSDAYWDSVKAHVTLVKYDPHAPYSGICSYGQASLASQTAYNKDHTVSITVTDTVHFKVQYIGETKELYYVDGKLTNNHAIDPNIIDSVGSGGGVLVIKTKRP